MESEGQKQERGGWWSEGYQGVKNVANRIRTCAGDPSRFLVCRLNHSAIATLLPLLNPEPINPLLTTHHTIMIINITFINIVDFPYNNHALQRDTYRWDQSIRYTTIIFRIDSAAGQRLAVSYEGIIHNERCSHCRNSDGLDHRSECGLVPGNKCSLDSRCMSSSGLLFTGCCWE